MKSSSTGRYLSAAVAGTDRPRSACRSGTGWAWAGRRRSRGTGSPSSRICSPTALRPSPKARRASSSVIDRHRVGRLVVARKVVAPLRRSRPWCSCVHSLPTAVHARSPTGRARRPWRSRCRRRAGVTLATAGAAPGPRPRSSAAWASLPAALPALMRTCVWSKRDTWKLSGPMASRSELIPFCTPFMMAPIPVTVATPIADAQDGEEGAHLVGAQRVDGDLDALEGRLASSSPHSERRATMGSSREARHAGYTPLATPTPTPRPIASDDATTRATLAGSGVAACTASASRIAHADPEQRAQPREGGRLEEELQQDVARAARPSTCGCRSRGCARSPTTSMMFMITIAPTTSDDRHQRGQRQQQDRADLVPEAPAPARRSPARSRPAAPGRSRWRDAHPALQLGLGRRHLAVVGHPEVISSTVFFRPLFTNPFRSERMRRDGHVVERHAEQLPLLLDHADHR